MIVAVHHSPSLVVSVHAGALAALEVAVTNDYRIFAEVVVAHWGAHRIEVVVSLGQDVSPDTASKTLVGIKSWDADRLLTIQSGTRSIP
jgi:hypothetical protein